MGAALPIADHHDASELRALARREKNGRAASRMVAIANALDGMTRLAAARLAGMDRQTLRDWVIRYNEDGIAGLHDQPKGHNPEKLSDSEQAVLLANCRLGRWQSRHEPCSGNGRFELILAETAAG